MRAGLKSSLIMQQESTMSRSGSLASDWFYLGRVRSLAEISAALDGLTPESVGEFTSRQSLDEMTLVTLGPKALKVPD
jgi:predicted Zn-dependent peptidase